MRGQGSYNWVWSENLQEGSSPGTGLESPGLYSEMNTHYVTVDTLASVRDQIVASKIVW